MFPIRDDNPTFLRPVTTLALIAANVAVWATAQGLGSDPKLAASVCELGMIPGDLLNRFPSGTHLPLGPDHTCVITSGPTWYTLFTSMFLHGGWFHLIGNMWFLWLFGNNVEDSMGHVRFVFFYLLCGLAAAALQLLSQPDSGVPMVGASGAIGGVMGAYIVLYPKVRVHMLLVLGFWVTRIVVPAVFMLGYWFLVQLVGGALAQGQGGGGVAFWAHVGGFGAGALFVMAFRQRALVARHPYYGWKPRRRG